MQFTLKELAERLGLSLIGDETRIVRTVAALDDASSDALSFFGDRKYRQVLDQTRAGCVVLREEDAESCPTAAILSPNPYLSYAEAAWMLHPAPEVTPGRHASAVIDEDARIDPSAWIGPLSVVEADVEIGAGVSVGPGCVIQRGCKIGAHSRLVARVTLCPHSILGQRVLLHPGSVIGRDGFGFARDGKRWVRLPQIGRAVLGDDVEIGVNSAVDRGAIGDTEIAAGVKLDSLIQIGHNVRVGENTAMAALTGVSGSTEIGANCTLAGEVGVAGHLQIGDEVHFTGQAMVTKSVLDPGVYSSGVPAMPNRAWRRNAARFRQLDELARRVKRLEAQLAENDQESGSGSD